MPAFPDSPAAAPHGRWLTWLWRAGLLLTLVVGGALAAVAIFLVQQGASAPSMTQLRQAEGARPSVLVSADGKTLATFSRSQQAPVTLAQVSPNVVNALLSTEDHRFYSHHGIDTRRTLAAMFHTATGQTQGGSTITQQLARNLFPQQIGRERTLGRKARELATALRIERNFSKPQILEAYLNSAPFPYNVVGIEMAARTFFDKPAAQLDELESATLIGMLKGTTYYNPVRYPERAQQRRNVVLAQMARHDHLPHELRQLSAAPLQVKWNRQPDPTDAAPHFVGQARKQLIDWADENDYNLYTDGLIIHATLDSRLQALATKAVETQSQQLQAVADVEWAQAATRAAGASAQAYTKLATTVDPFAHFWKLHPDLLGEVVAASPEYRSAVGAGATAAAAAQQVLADKAAVARLKHAKTRLEAGFVAIDPATGAVRAWVGGRDFDVDQFDHVAQAARQPGSTFKPFVYGAALESGFSPDRTYVDGAVEVALGDGNVWRPTDMHGATQMPMSLRDGLVYSKNTITVQVAQEVGVRRIASFAQSMGVDQSKLDPVPSLALGTSPVTLFEMVSAYATIARQGEYRKPFFIQRISDRGGAVLAQFGGETRRAMSEANAAELGDMMRGVIQRGTGTQIKTRFGISADAAGKTGTTQGNTDGWFIMMRPDLVAGAWVGFNDQRVTMRSSYWGQGGHNALLLVGEFFRDALKGGLTDAKARFPESRRPPPADAQAAENVAAGGEETWTPGEVTPVAAAGAGAPAGARPVPGIALVYGDRAGAAARRDDAPPKSAAELERSLAAMESAGGRAPVGVSVPEPLPTRPPAPARDPATAEEPVPRSN